MTSPSVPVASPATERSALTIPDAALVEEACKKSGLIWIAVPGARDRAAWHVWHEQDARGAVYVVVGGGEQSLPGLADDITVRVTVRSKDKGGRLVSWPGLVTRIMPGGAEWDAVVPVLHSKRLNAHDGEAQPERWAANSAVYRIRPQAALFEGPGRYATASGSAPVPPSAATTRSR
ncbi:MAG: hypothetical protein ACRDVE_19975 [Actinocrinis sp.]